MKGERALLLLSASVAWLQLMRPNLKYQRGGKLSKIALLFKSNAYVIVSHSVALGLIVTFL